MTDQPANEQFHASSFMEGDNAEYLEAMYARYANDPNAVDEARRIDRQFEPTINDGERRRLCARWNDAVERCKGWARIDDHA